jgi:carboxyl-terminal processing protease
MKIKIIISISLMFLFLGTYSQSERVFTPEQKFLRTLTLLKTHYVDTVNIEKAVESAIRGMLEKLDPHSVYMTPEETRRANEPLQGNFEGVGIQFQVIRDTVHIISTITGGPSEEVGIMPGDKIVEIDGENFTGSIVTNTSVAGKLRGQKGTKVLIGILRGTTESIISFEVIRDRIPIYSVDASFMLDENIGYIKVNRFSSTTMSEFEEAMKKLKEMGMKELVLDLRNNSGGFLRTAVEMSDQFFEKDKLIVYTEGVNMKGDRYFSSNKGLFIDGKLVVLIDHGSASASEIVSGAVQDWDRGVVIGRRSYGKGLVQRPFNYPDGSAVRLTTARYYTPTGRSIQKPYDDDKKKYMQELNDRLEKGEMVSIDSLDFPDSLMFTTPSGRQVYGGGGIMPDIFVPLDTARLSDYYIELSRKNIFNQFVSDYMQRNRKELRNKYPTVAELKADYVLKFDDLIEEIMSYAEKNGIEKSEMTEESKNFMGYVLVALIARNVFDQQAYFQVMMDIDTEIQQALSVLKSDQYQIILSK